MSQNLEGIEREIKSFEIDKTGAESVNDDNILDDVKNLFIEESSDKGKIEELPSKISVEETTTGKKNPTEPRVIFEIKKEDKEKTPKNASKEELKDKEKDSKESKDKVIKESKDKVVKESKDVASKQGCKSNSDCDSMSFCHQKSGKCALKFAIGQSGCTENGHCASESAESYALCHAKKCVRACKIGSSGWCSEGEGCMEVKGKDSKIFQGLPFTGVCSAKAKTATTISDASNVSKSSSSGLSKSSIAFLSSASVLLLIGSIIGFIYLRGYIKRLNRNKSPDMFLFNKLQRSTSQNIHQLSNAGPEVEQLNSRLSNVNGARFTRWAILSSD